MFQSILSRSQRSVPDGEGDTGPESPPAAGTSEPGPGSTADEGDAEPAATTALDEDAVYDMLGNDRRRASLKLLSRSETEWDVSDLSEQVAERVADPSTSPDDIYDSVYISLCQNHLPNLDEVDLVEYDSDEKTVRIGPAFDDLHRFWFADEEPEEPEESGSSAPVLAVSVLTALALGTVWLALPSLSGVVLPALIALQVSLAVKLGSDYSV